MSNVIVTRSLSKGIIRGWIGYYHFTATDAIDVRRADWVCYLRIKELLKECRMSARTIATSRRKAHLKAQSSDSEQYLYQYHCRKGGGVIQASTKKCKKLNCPAALFFLLKKMSNKTILFVQKAVRRVDFDEWYNHITNKAYATIEIAMAVWDKMVDDAVDSEGIYDMWYGTGDIPRDEVKGWLEEFEDSVADETKGVETDGEVDEKEADSDDDSEEEKDDTEADTT